MFTRPEQLSDDTVARVLATDWGLDVGSVEYLAVGFGSHHWSVLTANGGRWFATIDDLAAKRDEHTEPLESVQVRLDAALRTARRLREQGLDFVIAPTPADHGGVLSAIDRRFVVALYPWIEGRSHSYGAYDNELDRNEVLELLTSLHSIDPRDVPEARREDFTVPNRAGLMSALEDLETEWQTGPYGEPTRRLLRERAVELLRLLDRYDTLAAAAAEMPDRIVVTHGEPHAANTLSTPEGRVLIDWDTALLAPPERDLWMVLDHSRLATPPAYAPSGRVEVMPDLLDLYRMLWDLMEVAGYVSFFQAIHADTADAAESWTNLNTYTDVASRWPRI